MNELLIKYNKLQSRQEKRLFALKTIVKHEHKHLLEYEKLSLFTIDCVFYDYLGLETKEYIRKYTPKFNDKKHY